MINYLPALRQAQGPARRQAQGPARRQAQGPVENNWGFLSLSKGTQGYKLASMHLTLLLYPERFCNALRGSKQLNHIHS